MVLYRKESFSFIIMASEGNHRPNWSLTLPALNDYFHLIRVTCQCCSTTRAHVAVPAIALAVCHFLLEGLQS